MNATAYINRAPDAREITAQQSRAARALERAERALERSNDRVARLERAMQRAMDASQRALQRDRAVVARYRVIVRRACADAANPMSACAHAAADALAYGGAVALALESLAALRADAREAAIRAGVQRRLQAALDARDAAWLRRNIVLGR